jgi:hypothetical protein
VVLIQLKGAIIMAHYAKITPTNEENKFTVQEVIVADADFIATIGGNWKQTSYNTKGNVHYGADGQPDGLPALRGNYAGVGYTYDSINDVFYTAQPYPSWILNQSTWIWESPIPYPNDNGQYIWNEANQSWDPLTTLVSI